MRWGLVIGLVVACSGCVSGYVQDQCVRKGYESRFPSRADCFRFYEEQYYDKLGEGIQEANKNFKVDTGTTCYAIGNMVHCN